MGEIISVHSFRGGTGKSNLAANMAAILARQGKRVGIVDTDIQSPGVHVLFGYDESRMTRSLNDYLWGQAQIEDIAYDVSEVGRQDATRSYLSDLALWLGAALATVNVLLFALWPVSALGTYFQTRQEDELLASKFGAAYEAYAGQTRRLVPRFNVRPA